jgi:acyl carrier protein
MCLERTRNMDNIEVRIRETVSRIASLPFDIPGDANLYFDLGVASVHALQLLADLEGEFDVSIPDEDFVEATSISQLSALMRSLAVTSQEAHSRA